MAWQRIVYVLLILPLQYYDVLLLQYLCRSFVTTELELVSLLVG